MRTFTAHRRLAQTLLLVFILAAALRFVHLDADPPHLFSDLGEAVVTDPYFYTCYARNAVLFDDWTPYEEDQFTIFRYSMVSAASWVMFSLSGVSRVTANLTAVLLNLLGIALFLWGIYNPRRPLLALFTGFMLLANVLMFFYSRYPLLENGLLFLTGLSCFLYLKFRHTWVGLFLTGVFIALAGLAGKLFGYLLIVPVLGSLVWELRRGALMPVLITSTGTVLTSAVYLILVSGGSFAPFWEYLGNVENSTATTPGFDSVISYVRMFMSYLMQSRLPEYCAMLVPAAVIGGWLFVVGDGERESDNSQTSITFALVWVLVGVAAFCPVGYRPARYASFLYFPLSVLAGYLCERLANGGFKLIAQRSLTAFITAFLAMLLLIPVLVAVWFDGNSAMQSVMRQAWWVIIASVIMATAVTLLLHRKSVCLSRRVVRIILTVVLLLTAGQSAYFLIRIFSDSRYELARLNQELPALVDTNAVLTGTYAPAMTIDNNIKGVARFFGTNPPERDLFQRLPVTHLAVNQPTWQRHRDYLVLDKQTQILFIKSLRNANLGFYRIKQQGYPNTDFDRAMDAYLQGNLDLALHNLSDLLARHPDNSIALMFRTECLLTDGRYDDAMNESVRIAEMFPDSYHVQLFTAMVNAKTYHLTKSFNARLNTEKYYLRAQDLFEGFTMTVEEFLTQSAQ